MEYTEKKVREILDNSENDEIQFSSIEQSISLINQEISDINTVLESIEANEFEVVVKTLEDLPSPVSGTITLPNSNKLYSFYDLIDLEGNKILLGSNTFRGISQDTTGLYNGEIEITESCGIYNFRIDTCDFLINAPSKSFDWDKVNFYNCTDIEINNCSNLILETVGFLDSYGFKITGTVDSVILSPNCIFRPNGSSPIGYSTATFFEVTNTAIINRRIRIQDSVFQTNSASQKAIVFGSSATISLESFIMKTVRFQGNGTFLDGINGDNDKAFFFEVVGGNSINSTATFQGYIKNNTTPVACPVQNNRYKINLPFTLNTNVLQKFEYDAVNSCFTYISSVPRFMKIQASFTLKSGSGSNVVFGTYIGVKKATSLVFDPTVDRISESEQYITAESTTRPMSGFSQAIVKLEQGDKIYLIVQNTTGTQSAVYDFINIITEKSSV